MNVRSLRWFCLVFVPIILFLTLLAHADPVLVRYPQGYSHGYLALKTLDGKLIATGEDVQSVRGDRVTSRLIFHFLDGSIDDDSTVFTQRHVFRLISDHHIQRGPAFPKPIDFLIDGVTGQVTVRTPDGKVTQQHFDLPPDISNGLPPNLLLCILPSVAETKISYIIPSDKPRLIHLSIKPTDNTSFNVGQLQRKATDYIIHVELGGVAGMIAPMIGKEPPDYHIWVQGGVPPAFIREEGPIYEGGPILRMESIVPTFSH
jgi:hypothetical protein